MAALLLVSQIALSSIPNTELVSFLLIMFTLQFGAEVFAAAEVFALLEIAVYGLGLWNVMYLYIWAILVALVLLLKKYTVVTKYKLAVLSGLYGLAFGALCTIVYVIVTPTTALAWWIAGLGFDAWHGICNFIIMILLYTPVKKVLEYAAGESNKT